MKYVLLFQAMVLGEISIQIHYLHRFGGSSSNRKTDIFCTPPCVQTFQRVMTGGKIDSHGKLRTSYLLKVWESVMCFFFSFHYFLFRTEPTGETYIHTGIFRFSSVIFVVQNEKENYTLKLSVQLFSLFLSEL